MEQATMALEPTTKGSSKSSAAEPMQAPAYEPKRPQDNSAAKQSPKETQSAVKNSFGDVPTKGDKQPADAPKTSEGQPKLAITDPKATSSPGSANSKTSNKVAEPPTGGSAQSPADAKTSAPAADGKAPAYVTETGADPKAAPGAPGSPITGDNGQPLKTPDGRNIILGNNKNPIPVESDGRPMTDPKGNIYAVDKTGKYLETPDGKYGVYDTTNGNLVPADPLTGEAFKDPGGNTYFIDKNAAYVQTPDGKNVVYDPYGHTVAADKDGKIAADKNGYAYVVQADGKYTNAEGKDVVYDQAGNQIVKTGNKANIPAAYGSSTFVDVYKNTKTNELELTDQSGFLLKVDPATNALAKDANGLSIILHSPLDDPNRPPVKPNEDPQTTINNLPQGKEHGDPMEIKKGLFKNGYLDTDGMYAALAKYDVLDVYNALVKSSKDGGNNIPTALPEGAAGKIVQPNEEQAKQIIGTLIAWSNMNGHYSPVKEGQIPLIMLYEPENPKKADTGFTAGNGSGTVWVSGTSKIIPSILAHELNHEFANPIFLGTLNIESGKKLSQLHEAVAEYISSKWTGNHADSPREDPTQPVNEVKELQDIDATVNLLGTQLGGGDVNKGMDILQKAYFSGDPVAMELFMRAYRTVTGTA